MKINVPIMLVTLWCLVFSSVFTETKKKDNVLTSVVGQINNRGGEAIKKVDVVIEISKGSSVKYEEDKETGKLVVSRFLYTAMSYPFNYGYIANTLAHDGDPIDVAVISTCAVQSCAILPARVIGMLEMEDEAGIDHKIIAVPTEKIDPFYARIKDINDLDFPTKDLIKHFFEYYKSIEPGKWVKIKNFLGRDSALQAIEESKQAYLIKALD